MTFSSPREQLDKLPTGDNKINGTTFDAVALLKEFQTLKSQGKNTDLPEGLNTTTIVDSSLLAMENGSKTVQIGDTNYKVTPSQNGFVIESGEGENKVVMKTDAKGNLLRRETGSWKVEEFDANGNLSSMTTDKGQFKTEYKYENGWLTDKKTYDKFNKQTANESWQYSGDDVTYKRSYDPPILPLGLDEVNKTFKKDKLQQKEPLKADGPSKDLVQKLQSQG